MRKEVSRGRGRAGASGFGTGGYSGGFVSTYLMNNCPARLFLVAFLIKDHHR